MMGFHSEESNLIDGEACLSYIVSEVVLFLLKIASHYNSFVNLRGALLEEFLVVRLEELFILTWIAHIVGVLELITLQIRMKEILFIHLHLLLLPPYEQTCLVVSYYILYLFFRVIWVMQLILH